MASLGTPGAASGGTLKDIAYANMIQIIQARTVLGFVPNFASGTGVSFDRTEPQIGAYVVQQVHAKWRDDWVVQLLFPALLSWNNWVWTHRRGEGVLTGPDGHADLIVLGSDPTDPPCRIGGFNNMQAARYESGLDNSPMYDLEGPSFAGYQFKDFDNETTHHMSLYDVGMTALYLSDTEALIALAEVAARPDVVPELQARFSRVQTAMNAHMWDAEAGMYSNVSARGRRHQCGRGERARARLCAACSAARAPPAPFPPPSNLPSSRAAQVLYNGSFYRRWSPTSFFPLISGSASDAQAEALAASLASPLGFCFNASHTPMDDAAMIVNWWDGAHDNAECLTDECTRVQVDTRYSFIQVAAVARLPSAGPAPGLVPLATWFSASRGDTALTNSTTQPPDADGGYEFVRLEGWCYAAPPPAGAWPAANLSLWYSAARKDYKVCGENSTTPRNDCFGDAGYEYRGTLCWGWNGNGAQNLPCKFGGNSIARADAAFLDNDVRFFAAMLARPPSPSLLHSRPPSAAPPPPPSVDVAVLARPHLGPAPAAHLLGPPALRSRARHSRRAAASRRHGQGADAAELAAVPPSRREHEWHRRDWRRRGECRPLLRALLPAATRRPPLLQRQPSRAALPRARARPRPCPLLRPARSTGGLSAASSRFSSAGFTEPHKRAPHFFELSQKRRNSRGAVLADEAAAVAADAARRPPLARPRSAALRHARPAGLTARARRSSTPRRRRARSGRRRRRGRAWAARAR